jgi:hypothetical protein
MDAKEQEAKVTLRQHLIQAHEFRGDQLVSSSPNHALSEFTTAIELLLSVASNPKASPVQRTRCRTACKHLMERAETLKRHIQLTQQIKVKDPVMKPPPLPLVRKRTSRVLPQSETKLSVKEETILLKSSKINGGIFPPLKPATTPVVVDTAEPFT